MKKIIISCLTATALTLICGCASDATHSSTTTSSQQTTVPGPTTTTTTDTQTK